jgi:hypothetical protein
VAQPGGSLLRTKGGLKTMASSTKPYIPPARVWNALELADLPDAAGIDCDSAAEMNDNQWHMLSVAAGIRRTPSQTTRAMVLKFLYNREAARSLLARSPAVITFPQEQA